MINDHREYEKMAQVEQKLWWYKILHEKVLRSLVRNKIKKEELIVDLGCGTGGLLQKLAESGYNAIGVDVSESAIDFCKKKSLTIIKGSLLDINETWFKSKPGVVISNDSLYFFSDEEINKIFSNFNNILAVEGLVIINYPVLKAFSGVHDLSVGIKKRKSKKELEFLITNNGYKILHADYWPFFLSPLIYLVRTIQRIKLKVKKDVSIVSDVHLPPNLLNKLFYYITKSENIISYKPWGSSLFIVAQRGKNNG